VLEASVKIRKILTIPSIVVLVQIWGSFGKFRFGGFGKISNFLSGKLKFFQVWGEKVSQVPPP
jgi:hypothetical protein